MQIIDRSIESAKSEKVVRAPVVNLKVRKNGNKTSQMDIIRTTTLPEVGSTVVKIINDCDPASFLSDIVNGLAIQCHVVEEDGTVVTFYETPSLNKRIEVAKFLAERFMPKVAVVKHAHIHKTVESPNPSERTNFEQMITHASEASPSQD